MTTSNRAPISDQIRDFSVLEELDPDQDVELQDFLLKVASTLRQGDMQYHIEYRRPDRPVFRLRSEEPLAEPIREQTITFLDPGRELILKVSEIPPEILQGLAGELRILGEYDDDEDEVSREPELNLLLTRTFRAELYAEFQRWERYGAAFVAAVIDLDPEADWRDAGKELKHLGKTRDVYGKLGETRVAGFFRSRPNPGPLRQKLQERISTRFPNQTAQLDVFHVPTDLNDWLVLQDRIFQPETSKESDSVGSQGN